MLDWYFLNMLLFGYAHLDSLATYALGVHEVRMYEIPS